LGLALLSILVVEMSIQALSAPAPAEVRKLAIKVLAVYPHDPGAFTQGLLVSEGHFFESTGLNGNSSIRKVEMPGGRVLLRRALDARHFGEGLALVDRRLIQLTWKSGIAFVYDRDSLEPIGEFGFNGEGWGLTYDGNQLIMSDGSPRLTFRDPDDFRWQATLEIKEHGNALANLNELEYVEGQIYANVWGEERIVRIDARTGEVNASIDAARLLPANERKRVDVLNGIAWDSATKSFWLTGKFWPKMFQVVFVEP
jgi:glutaminyl-peptide cyclotransferase